MNTTITLLASTKEKHICATAPRALRLRGGARPFVGGEAVSIGDLLLACEVRPVDAKASLLHIFHALCSD